MSFSQRRASAVLVALWLGAVGWPAGQTSTLHAQGSVYVFHELAGSATRGSRDGPADQALFEGPAGLARDAAGILYVVDSSAVRQVLPSGTVTTLAGTAGIAGFADGTGAAARFSNPQGVAVDTAGNVYVADSGNHLVRKITPAGVVTTLAGALTSTSSVPTGVAVDSAGNVYVANSGRHSIERVTPSGSVTTLSASAAFPDGGVDSFGHAVLYTSFGGIAIGPNGTLYVTDNAPTADFNRGRGRVCAIAPDGGVSLISLGAGGLGLKNGIAVDAAGHIFVVSLAGSGLSPTTTGISRADGVAVTGVLSNMYFNGIAVDNAGTVYVADIPTRAIGALSGGTLRWVAGKGGCESTLITVPPMYSLDGTGAAARFCAPAQLAVDAAGVVYVADAGAHVSSRGVRRVTADGTVTSLPVYSEPYGVTVDPFGNVFATGDESVIRKIQADGTVTTLAGASFSLGAADGAGGAARFTRPRGLASDSQGTIYVADTGNNTIRKVTPDGTVTTLAGLAGTSGPDDGAGAAARFNEPNGLALDGAGNIYVADVRNRAIRKITPAGVVSTLGVFTSPSSIAVDSAGTLFFVDNGTLQQIVLGASIRIGSATSVATDTHGQLFVFDSTGILLVGALADPVAPLFASPPANLVLNAGQSAVFKASATGSPEPVYQWQVSTNHGTAFANLTEGPSVRGVATPTLTITGATPSLSGRQYRVVATNTAGTVTSSAATLTVNGLDLSPSTLRFGARRSAASGFILSATPSQLVAMTYGGQDSPTFSVSADQVWIATGAVDAASRAFTVGINNSAMASSTPQTGTITVTASTGATATLPVTLTVTDSGASAAPIGQMDAPAQAVTGLQGAIGVTGWVVDDVGLRLADGVKIYRNCVAGEPAINCQTGIVPGAGSIPVVFVGDATFVSGARPDIEAAFPAYPAVQRAGWGYLMLTNLLPRTTGPFAAYGGQGALTLYAIAEDLDGHRALLGRSWTGDTTPTTITMDNDSIAKPFGAIDTPSQGGTVSGLLANFGWALTPDGNTQADSGDILIPTNGSSMVVFIDGVAMSAVAYNQCRGTVGNPVPATAFCNDDVADIFGNATPQAALTTRTANATRYRNLDAGRAAVGAFAIDTTTLTNGLHTIAWSVTDSAGRVEGIGSRLFTVLNGGADPQVGPSAPERPAASLDALTVAREGVWARTGFDLQVPFTVVYPVNGARTLAIDQMGRVELWLGPGIAAGYLVANDTLRGLPPGSHFDSATGQFTWAPGPGYLGTYRLVFLRRGDRLTVDVTISGVRGVTF